MLMNEMREHKIKVIEKEAQLVGQEHAILVAKGKILRAEEMKEAYEDTISSLEKEIIKTNEALEKLKSTPFKASTK